MTSFKYEYVAETVKDKILNGSYRPGSKLPSIQGLAKELSMNTDTIIRAYTLLESQNLIYSVAKSGYYVMKSTSGVQETTSTIDMITASPSIEVNPYKDFYHCMEKAISLYGYKLFEYSPPKGMPELINMLKKHMVNYQIFTKEQNIFVTTGVQQALFILTLIEFPNNGDTVLVEQPTYDVMLNILSVNNSSVIGIRRTKNGVDLAELERIFAQNKIKFFYLMPRFQNPTGFSYNNVQKKEILRLAKKYCVYIVEDDYLADLEINPKNDPLASFDTDNMVIYVKSFSKTFLPGLRLGMAIIPEQLQSDFTRVKRSIDLNSSVFSQGALEIYLRSSMYKSHVKRIKSFYSKKMEALSAECKNELEGVLSYHIPSTGIFAYIETTELSEESLINRLEKNGLKSMGMGSSYMDNFAYTPGIKLCTCKVDIKSIPRAVQTIKKTVLQK